MKEIRTNTYVGKGNSSMQDEYIDFINYVFGFNGTDKCFYKLLPKLYKPEYDPAGSSYVVLEGGKLKAAVGAYSHEIEVAGEKIRCRGIGNVAVHPYSRGCGYMKESLGMAMEDMVKDHVDLSILGGRRARYNYFSFERAGTTLRFKFSADAIRHHFGKERTSRFSYRFLKENDEESLDAIAALIDRQSFRPIRPRDRLYDVLASWGSKTLVVTEGERFVGYLVCGDGDISEILLVNDDDFVDVIVGAYDRIGKRDLSVVIPSFRPDYAKKLCRVAESYEVTSPKMFSVLCYRRVLGAFLKLKASYEALPDGELTVLIHGFAGDETLRITVSGGVPSVEDTEGDADLEVGHLDAMNLFFASYDPNRDTLPTAPKVWLPLPLYMYNVDIV